MLSKDKFTHEFRDALVLQMLENINFLIHTLNCFFISFILKPKSAPPKRVFFDEAATTLVENPCHLVPIKLVVELSALNNCAFESFVCFWSIFNRRFVIVSLRRCWIDTANQGVSEFEILKRLDKDAESCPNNGGKTTDKTEKKIKGADCPFDFILPSRLDDKHAEEGLVILLVSWEVVLHLIYLVSVAFFS